MTQGFFSSAIEEVKDKISKIDSGRVTVCVLLEGVLGAGKTTFVQEFLATLGLPAESVQSPTFLKALEYELPARETVLHLDCYRMDNEVEIVRLGLEAFRSARLWLIEWPELFLNCLRLHPELVSLYGLSATAVEVHIEFKEGGTRTLKIQTKILGT